MAPDGKYFHRGARRLPEDNSRAEADSERSGEFAGQPRRKIAPADINNERNHEHLEGEKNREIGERQRLHADHAGHRTERLQHRASEAGLRPARREKAGQLQLRVLGQVVAQAVAKGRSLFRWKSRFNTAARQMRGENNRGGRTGVRQSRQDNRGLRAITEDHDGQAGWTAPFPRSGRSKHFRGPPRIRAQPGVGRPHEQIEVGRFQR